jgi:uncharacterized protein YkwD
MRFGFAIVAAAMMGGSAMGQSYWIVPGPPAQYGTTAGAAGDPAAFLAWLNATRAAYRLPAVGYDPNMEAWAHQNNLRQAAGGIGHFVMGPARRQNAAWNAGFPGVEAMWMASPGHRAALLDPTITHIGIAWYAGYSTFNAW